VVVIHDGQRIYHGTLGRDWDLSRIDLEQIEKESIIPIGLFLSDFEDAAELAALFPRLVVSSDDELPNRLGNLLSSLC